ncbi:MAG: hypothetical protein LAO20_10330 [Acidobacteriia bacterium]|nr:hypothetical protein [Terriglobia bacterium]
MRYPVINEGLAATATRIAREKRISFGEALTLARREPVSNMSDATNAESIRQPCTDAMLRWIPILTAPGGPRQINTFINEAVAQVESALEKLGLGRQLVDGIEAVLSVFLNKSLMGNTAGEGLSPADARSVVANAADACVQAYADGLRNKIATQDWNRVNPADTLKLSDDRRSYVDITSITLRDTAMAISKQRGFSFGEALTLARHGEICMATDVLEADHIKQIVESELRGFFAKVFAGKQEMILDAGEVFQAGEAVSSAMAKLNLGATMAGTLKAKLTDFLNNILDRGKDHRVSVSASDVASMATKAADLLAKAYAGELATLRG